MTENLRNAIEIINRGNAEEIPYDEQLLIDWLDDKVEAKNKIKEIRTASPLGVSMGVFKETPGKYEVEIDTCDWLDERSANEVHIFCGLEILAKVVGAEITERRHCVDNFRCEFKYKGITFFELHDAGRKLK